MTGVLNFIHSIGAKLIYSVNSVHYIFPSRHHSNLYTFMIVFPTRRPKLKSDFYYYNLHIKGTLYLKFALIVSMHNQQVDAKINT